MMTNVRRLPTLFTALILALLGGVPRPAGAAESACVPGTWRLVDNSAFSDHERLSYTVDWGVFTAGKAALSVEGVEPVRGRPAYHLSMDIRAAGLTKTFHPYTDRTDSWLDHDALATVRYVKRVREDHYQMDATVNFDTACGRIHTHEHRLDKNLTEDRDGAIPPNTLDTYGALFYLRTQPLAVGQGYDLELYSGDKVTAVTARVLRRERVSVPAGWFDCFLVEPTARDTSAAGKIKQIQWWLTADARHLPVRIRMELKVGHIDAGLTK